MEAGELTRFKKRSYSRQYRPCSGQTFRTVILIIALAVSAFRFGVRVYDDHGLMATSSEVVWLILDTACIGSYTAWNFSPLETEENQFKTFARSASPTLLLCCLSIVFVVLMGAVRSAAVIFYIVIKDALTSTYPTISVIGYSLLWTITSTMFLCCMLMELVSVCVYIKDFSIRVDQMDGAWRKRGVAESSAHLQRVVVNINMDGLPAAAAAAAAAGGVAGAEPAVDRSDYDQLQHDRVLAPVEVEMQPPRQHAPARRANAVAVAAVTGPKDLMTYEEIELALGELARQYIAFERVLVAFSSARQWVYSITLGLVATNLFMLIFMGRDLLRTVSGSDDDDLTPALVPVLADACFTLGVMCLCTVANIITSMTQTVAGKLRDLNDCASARTNTRVLNESTCLRLKAISDQGGFLLFGRPLTISMLIASVSPLLLWVVHFVWS